MGRAKSTNELRDDAVAAVAVLVRELVGALRWVEVGAEDEQALCEVLVRLKLQEACAVVAAAPGPCAVLLVPLVGDPVREVREVAQIVLEVADEAVVRVVGQGTVQLRVEVRLHEVELDVARLFVLVLLGREHVREPKAFIRWFRVSTKRSGWRRHRWVCLCWGVRGGSSWLHGGWRHPQGWLHQ